MDSKERLHDDHDSPDFNSLADFMAGDGFVEIKLPWQLLNFSDPSLMTIHDDYYEHYGIEYIEIDEIWADTPISLPTSS